MLSGVFHFVLPEISSHFVLHDLLRSFRLECPLSSSRVPPWDLLVVLQFLHGPPFEPLASASLRSLTQKVLFLVSLATACRVGELQAVSCEDSFSGSDAHLSYLPESRSKTESAVSPLPRSFCDRLLKDLWVILWTSSFFVQFVLCVIILLVLPLSLSASSHSPRSPSRSLLKSALSFFLRDVISWAYSSSSSSAAGPSSSASALSSSWSYSVRGVAASRAFARNTCHPFWLRRLGRLLQSSPPSISRMYSSLLLLVLAWVLSWQLVLWCRCF